MLYFSTILGPSHPVIHDVLWRGVNSSFPSLALCFADRSCITLEHALETLLPEFFSSKPTGRAADTELAETPDSPPDDPDSTPTAPRDGDPAHADAAKNATKVKLVRVQGIDLSMEMDIPFLWVANNLKNPECYLHVCIYVGSAGV